DEAEQDVPAGDVAAAAPVGRGPEAVDEPEDHGDAVPPQGVDPLVEQIGCASGPGRAVQPDLAHHSAGRGCRLSHESTPLSPRPCLPEHTWRQGLASRWAGAVPGCGARAEGLRDIFA